MPAQLCLNEEASWHGSRFGCLIGTPAFAQESSVGFPLLLWQYTSTALSTPSNQPLTHFNFSRGCMPGVFLYFILFFFFKTGFQRPTLITRLPGNSRSPLPKAELRGRRVPMKKSWYPYRVGPESDEAWERRVPLNSLDRATWAKQGNISKTSARRASNWQQLRPYNGLISSRRRSSSGTHHLLPFPL